MISEDIRALSARFEDFRHAGCELNAEGVDNLMACLESIAGQVDALERTPVPYRLRQPARVGGNVVSIFDAMGRRGGGDLAPCDVS